MERDAGKAGAIERAVEPRGALIPANGGTLVAAPEGAVIRTEKPQVASRLRESAPFFLDAFGAAAMLGSQLGLLGWTLGYSIVMLPYAALSLRDRYRARRFARIRRTEDLGGVRPGTVVRIRARIVEGPTFEAAVSRRRAVVAWYGGVVRDAAAKLRGARPVIEVHAVDFQVALASGARVRICVDPAPVSLDEVGWSERGNPHPLRRGVALSRTNILRAFVHDESSLGPGDGVEIVGRLELVPDPAGERAHLRDIPLAPALRGAPGSPLIVGRARW